MIKKILIFLPLYIVWIGAAGYMLFGLCTACLDPGLLQLASIGGYLVVIIIPVLLFILWMNAVPGWMEKVQADGTEATATILSVENTGMVINNTVAVVKLRLRVDPPNEAPFEISLEQQISMLVGLGGYTAGAQLKVKYDPANKNHLVIIGEPDGRSNHRAETGSAVAQASNPGSDISQKLEELSKLHKSGELSDSEFAAAKKKLLG